MKKMNHKLICMSLVCFIFGTATAFAQMTPPVILSTGKIDKIAGVGIDQRLGNQVPLDATFTNSQGQQVQLSQYFGKRPVLLNLIFFRCKATCTLETEGLVDSFAKMTQLNKNHDIVGQDVDVLTLSINPIEGPTDSSAKRKEVLSALEYPQASSGWHFLTGDVANIQKVVSAVGFQYTLDQNRDLINHPAAIVMLTPQGKVSQYFFGSAYPVGSLHDAIALAGSNQVGKEKQEILLGCFCLDPATGKYSADINQILKVLGTLTLIVVAGGIFTLTRSKPKHSKRFDGGSNHTG